MNAQERTGERRRQAGRRGFTLIELLVVMLIILLVSAVVLPTVIPAISHRQVSEAARILQGALAGARDTAINTNAPAGIRLLPDPVFNGINPTTATLDPTRVLASNRYILIQLAPNYSEGKASVIIPAGWPSPFGGTGFLPYANGQLIFYPGGGCWSSNARFMRIPQAAPGFQTLQRPGSGTFVWGIESSSGAPPNPTLSSGHWRKQIRSYLSTSGSRGPR